MLSRIKKIEKQLKKKGADFAAIAKELSEGPSKAKGGDLGYFTAKQMLKPSRQGVFDESRPNIRPVKTRFGYHIIRVFDSKPERKKSFDEVQEQISKSLRTRSSSRSDVASGDLKKNATIVSNLPEPPAPQPRKNVHGGKGGSFNPHAGIPGAPDPSRPRSGVKAVPVKLQSNFLDAKFYHLLVLPRRRLVSPVKVIASGQIAAGFELT